MAAASEIVASLPPEQLVRALEVNDYMLGEARQATDADIVIWDAEKKTTITQDMLHHDTDYTPYEGMDVTGWPAVTLSRGKVVWNDGEVGCEAGWGQFLARAPYDYIKPSGKFPTPFNPITGKIEG